MPISATTNHPLSVGTLLWRSGRGPWQCTAIAKATVELAAGAAARLVEPIDLVGDTGFEDDGGEGLRVASDYVPHKPRADVVVVGRACARSGQAVSSMTVGLGLALGTEVLLAKQVGALGEHRDDDDEPAPFGELELRYEHAWRGRDDEIPVGVDPQGREGARPRLVDPFDSRRPAGLGPVPGHWPWRAAKLLPAERHLPSESPLCLPDELDLSYFNSAPPDQQLPYLRGGEQLLLEGMHPIHHELRCRLPALLAHAVLQQEGRPPRSVSLVCDTLWIDADKMIATITWRGSTKVDLAVADGAADAELHVVLSPLVHLEESAGSPPQWSAARQVAGEKAPERGPTEALPILNPTPLPACSFAWQLEPPGHHRIVVVKGSFDLCGDAPAELAPLQDALRGDEYCDGNAAASLSYPSDYAPFKPRADVVVLGRAYRSGQEPVALVRLELGDQIDKQIAAMGDRHWLGSAKMSEPDAFDSIPLRYEHAYGGKSVGDNPAGLGADDPDGRLPNLEWPKRLMQSRDDVPPPACLAPLAPHWPVRADVRGSYDRRWREERWPFFPADFDWGFYNAAPADQRCAYLRGDERYRITSVRPRGEHLTGTLPEVTPRCFALRCGARSDDERLLEVALRLDTAVFDAEALTVRLLWRGLVEVADEDATDLECLYLLLGRAGQRISKAEAWMRLEAARDKRFAPLAGQSTEASDAHSPTEPSGTTVAQMLKQRAAPLPGGSADRIAALSVLSEPPPEPAVVARPQIEAWLATGQSLAGRDLSGADLSGLDLSEQDLRGAILKGAKLRGATLDRARCVGINLVEADAGSSSWQGADLTRADGTKATLREADLSGAKLGQAALSEADLEGAKLPGVQADGAELVRAQLRSADLSGASLKKADLSYARLGAASFERARLDDAKLYEAEGPKARFDEASAVDARFEGAKLSEASLRDAKASGSSFERAELSGARFDRADLRQAGFVGADLSGATLDQADAREARFLKASLARASLRSADLMQASFERARLEDADLRGANLYQAETLGATLDGAKLDGAFTAGSKLVEG